MTSLCHVINERAVYLKCLGCSLNARKLSGVTSPVLHMSISELTLSNFTPPGENTGFLKPQQYQVSLPCEVLEFHSFLFSFYALHSLPLFGAKMKEFSS